MATLQEEKIGLLNYASDQFSFLVEDHGFLAHSHTQQTDYFSLAFTNSFAKRQLEIVLHRDSHYMLITLKRIGDSGIPSYYDVTHVVEVKDLALFHAPDTFSFQDHIVYSTETATHYLTKLVARFKSDWAPYVTGSAWIDRAQIDELYLRKGFKGKSGFSKDALLARLEQKLFFLTDHHYEIIESANSQEPFRSRSSKDLVFYHAQKDLFLKFELKYQDQLFSFYKRQSSHQAYRLLNFTPITSPIDEEAMENLAEKWVYSEIDRESLA